MLNRSISSNLDQIPESRQSWSTSTKSSVYTRYVIFLLSICIAITTASIIVCLTTTRKSGRSCKMVINKVNGNSVSNDSHPRAFVIYDFNNDNKLDIVVANSGTNNIGILVGNGDGTFSDQVTQSTGIDSKPLSIAMGDFNNDTQQDIVIANYGIHNVKIMFGAGNGTFPKHIDIDTRSSRPVFVAVGDFNDDSQLDIVTLNDGTNIISIFLAYKNQTFANEKVLSAAYDSLPSSAVVDDLNNDMKLDIVVTNYGTNNIIIFFGDGSGEFPIIETISTGVQSHPSAIDTADINGDRKIDIIVANSGTNSIYILFGNGNRSFTIGGNYSTERNSIPMSITVGDFNRDHLSDIVVANAGTNNVGVFFGFGNGTFIDQRRLSTGSSSQPYFVSGADLNGDGRKDIVVSNFKTNNIDILFAYANVTVSKERTYSVGLDAKPYSIAVDDINNDRLFDIVVPNVELGNIVILFGNGDGTFSNQTMYPVGNDSIATGVAIGNISNDKFPDVVVSYITSNGHSELGVFFGDGSGKLTNFTKTTIDGNYPPLCIKLADINNDSRLDVVVASSNGIFGTVRILFQTKNYAFSRKTNYLLDDLGSPQSVAIADLNNDNKLDIVTCNKYESNVDVFLGNGDGTFGKKMSFSTGYYAQTRSVALGDIDSDGYLDIVVANLWNNNVGILFGYGNGTFTHQKTQTTGVGSHPRFVVTCDFNNDNQLDIFALSTEHNFATILFGNGDRTFYSGLNFSTGDDSLPIAAVLKDINNDTLLDIIITNYKQSNVAVFLGTEDAKFTKGTILSTGSSSGPYSVTINDINNDQFKDIIIANYIADNIRIFQGDGNGNFRNPATYSSGAFSSPTSVITNDFDGDKLTDTAICNSGTSNIGVFYGSRNNISTNYVTYALIDDSNPQSIASGDFNNDNRIDIVTANYDADSISVLINSIGGSFRSEVYYSTGYSSNPHGIATGDLNNDNILDIVVANNGVGTIGIFYGTRNATFLSQIEYLYGNDSYPNIVQIHDFNNDTRLDIVVVDNVNFKIIILLQDNNRDFVVNGSYDTGPDSWPTTIAVNDINGDKKLDIVLGNYKTNDIHIFLGNGDGSFHSNAYYKLSDEPGLRTIIIADFNNDHFLDLAISNSWGQSVGIMLGFGNGTFAEQIMKPTSTNFLPLSIAAGDFDGDGLLDIVAGNAGTDNVGVRFGNGDGTFSEQLLLSTGPGSQPVSVAVGDFNNDDRLDIVVVNQFTSSICLFLGHVNRNFFSPSFFSGQDRFEYPRSIAVADFNNDGLLDVAVTNGYGENLGIYFGHAHINFLNIPPYFTGWASQPKHVAVAHLNNDRFLDVVVANSGTDNIMIFRGEGHGLLRNYANYSTGTDSKPSSIAIHDLNNDTYLDILVTNTGADNIGIFLGNGNNTFLDQHIYSTGVKSKPSSISVGDFNNDTHLDIAVSNYESNNVGILFGDGFGKFSNQAVHSFGFESHPIALTSDDLNRDNVSDIVVVNNGYGDVEILLKIC